jgi:hypothetical protein
MTVTEITAADLKLLKSERLTDNADGGGRMTGNVVVDGQLNEVFNDISQLDRTTGRVSMRKTFLAVHSLNTAVYLGAHAIITDPPDDPNVNVTIFETGSWTDERTAARDRIESYSIQGPEARWLLYGDHIVGQRTLRLYSMTLASPTKPSPDATPEAGEVYMLSIEAQGYTPDYQFVRITKLLSRDTQQFTDEGGQPYYRDVVIIEIGQALRYAFPGTNPVKTSTFNAKTKFRTTQVADASEYYGVKKLTAQADTGDLTVHIGSPYGALVPSAQSQNPLVDQHAAGTKANYVQSGAAGSLAASADLEGSVSPEYQASLHLTRGLLPGSLELSIGGAAYKDDGSGNIILDGAGAAVYGGTVDYGTGQIVITKASSWAATVEATATPAVAVYDSASSLSIPITTSNRGYAYVQTLNPKPTPGSLQVEYRALGKWYSLQDDGVGHLAGASGVGTGTVDYATGSVTVTLGALPDFDSALTFAWATPNSYTMQAGTLSPANPLIEAALTPGNPARAIDPATLVITWTDGGAKTATCDAAGQITGDATGAFLTQGYLAGQPVAWKLAFRPNSIPASGTVFAVAWDERTFTSESIAVSGHLSGTTASFTLANTNLKPGTVRIEYEVSQTKSHTQYSGTGAGATSSTETLEVHVIDDGDGGLKLAHHGTSVGTIDYATGAVSFTALREYAYKLSTVSAYLNTGGGGGAVVGYRTPPTVVTNHTGTQAMVSSNIAVTYNLVADPASAQSANVTLSQLTVDLNADALQILAGSVRFTTLGHTYIDREGALYHSVSNTTNAGTLAGTIDYSTGLATLTNWTNASATLSLLGMVTAAITPATAAVYFRVPGAPLSTGQFIVRATTLNGEQLTGSADNNGLINASWMVGQIDWESGVGALEFGSKQLDSGLPASLKAAPWYDADNIGEDGKIWVPLLVDPNTVFYDAVTISYIPLDADLLGVDTVRLPLDGRVPLFRVGNVAVIHNTQTLALPNPVTAGSVHDLGRTRLAYAHVLDADDVAIPTDRYTADLDAGTVTFSDPLNLTGYAQPLKVQHRIEDMALVADVQITGEITLAKPVTHDYPANTSYVSSALIIGDLWARVEHLFDQETWNNVWANTVSGSNATATYNDTLYPLTVTNKGAIQERWALVFTSSTNFQCYGEDSGLIGIGDINTDFSPVNDITGQPYFTIASAGWGGGWSAGNVLRFNTVAANYPVWIARTTLQSDPAVFTDAFKLQVRGDSN